MTTKLRNERVGTALGAGVDVFDAKPAKRHRTRPPLYLRKVIHSQAQENYRVILKDESDEVEVGSIGLQHGGAWTWAIDTVIPIRTQLTQGEGTDRKGLHAAAARSSASR